SRTAAVSRCCALSKDPDWNGINRVNFLARQSNMYLLKQLRIAGVILALALAVPSVLSAAPSNPLLGAVMMAPPIFIRQERDQRVSSYAEPFAGENTAHVFLCLSDQTVPYAFSLGWFVPAKGKEAASCLDEFGERIPSPMEKPERAGFNKADLAALR